MATFVKKNVVPETKTGDEGSAKRNIIRKGGAVKSRKGTASGQAIDDGSLYEDPSALDYDDPNYDSEEEDGSVTIPTKAPLHRNEIGQSKLTLTAYKKKVEPIIAQFFLNEDFDDIARSIEEIEAPEYSYELVKRMINMSIDRSDRERELTSRLLSEFFPHILSSNMIGKGFERLFEIVDEVEKDAPAAGKIIATFLARSVVDEVLPPSFLADTVICNLGGEIVDRAKHMLSRDHSGAKLERSWGPGDGRPVEDLKVAIDMLVMEYLLSGDVGEAIRCLAELNVPLFHHEVVKRAVTHALDKDAEKQALVSRLLAFLVKNENVSLQQAVKGFNRLHAIAADLALDVPAAGAVLAQFVERAKGDGVLPRDYIPTVASL